RPIPRLAPVTTTFMTHLPPRTHALLVAHSSSLVAHICGIDAAYTPFNPSPSSETACADTTRTSSPPHQLSNAIANAAASSSFSATTSKLRLYRRAPPDSPCTAVVPMGAPSST